MHCSGCGLILGKDPPPDLCSCPRCSRIFRIHAYHVDDGYDRPKILPLDNRKRFAALYVSEVMLRFLLSTRTGRPDFWEPLVIKLEEERLRAFAQDLSWTLTGIYRDPGPHVTESGRPFEKIFKDLEEGLVNTILVSDFTRVTRKDLLALWEKACEHDALVVSVAPHISDRNLAFEEIDYESVADSWGTNDKLDEVWTDEATTTLHKLFDAVGWHWTYYAADLIARSLGSIRLQTWRESDPACQRHHWREVLTNYAIARSRRNGDIGRLPLPELRPCTLCKGHFLDAALPVRFLELTDGTPSYCPNCLRRAFFQREGVHASSHIFAECGPSEIDSPQFVEGATATLCALPNEQLESLLRTVLDRLQASEARAGSELPSNIWLGAVRDLGIVDHLGASSRVESFYKADDGHLATSLGAALLDNWLSANGVNHRPDSRYPQHPTLNPTGTMRSDLLVGDAFVEFLGMRGRDEFEKQIDSRVELARAERRRIVGFYAEDLLSPELMRKKAAPILGAA